jgi:ABC-type dipeptide/oligopeptide/nickel transport system permease component
MLRFVLGRLAIFPIQLFAAITFIFLVIHALPGSPVSHDLGFYQSPQLIAKLKQQLGLGEPLLTQYGDYLKGIVHGDLGRSFSTSNAVTTDLRELFPATLELALASLLVALVVGGTFGVLSGLRARGPIAGTASAYRLIAGAIPEFLLGLIFIYFLVNQLKIFPGPTGQLDPIMNPPPRVTGMYVVDAFLAGEWEVMWSALQHLALPALALGLSAGGPIARLLRVVISGARSSDYVQYAHLAGLRRRSIVLYTTRSALVPLITLFAVLLVLLIGQSVAVEVVFSWGGLGQYMVNAVLISDYPGVQGVVLITTTFVLLVYLLADILQAVLDPRLKPAPRRRRGGGFFAALRSTLSGWNPRPTVATEEGQ